eukprot:SAG22_NODE_7185_length_765_cov_1.397898_1_plen_25_part_10
MYMHHVVRGGHVRRVVGAVAVVFNV